MKLNAELLMLVGGAGAFVLTVYWVYSRDLREKYAVGWLLLAFLLLLCGLFPGTIMAFADASHLSYAAAVLFVALGAMYLFSFGVSVTLTHQHRRNLRLTEEVALLEQRLGELERRLEHHGSAA